MEAIDAAQMVLLDGGHLLGPGGGACALQGEHSQGPGAVAPHCELVPGGAELKRPHGLRLGQDRAWREPQRRLPARVGPRESRVGRRLGGTLDRTGTAAAPAPLRRHLLVA